MWYLILYKSCAKDFDFENNFLKDSILRFLKSSFWWFGILNLKLMFLVILSTSENYYYHLFIASLMNIILPNVNS